MSVLALYEHAREALAAAVRIDEVLDIRDEAERAKAYARIAKDRHLQANAIELGARAERKLGILLRRVKEGGLLSQGGRPVERSNVSEPETGDDGEPVFDQTPFTLADIGVSKKLSSRAQQLAALDEAEFETVVSDKREKILSVDAPIVSPPRPAKPAKADKPAKPQALEPRRFHQFAFAVLSLSVASDRVGSRAIQFLARECGVLGQGDDNLDFTPEAEAAMGNILVAALSALGKDKELPGTANQTAGGFPVAAAPGKAEQLGETEATREANPGTSPVSPDVTGGESAAPDFLEGARLREAYEGEVALLAPQKGGLSMKLAEPAMRAGYAAEVPLAIMCQDLGHPHGTLAGWAHRLGLTSAARMLANQKRYGGAA